MKKILFMLSLLGITLSANAASTSGILNISGALDSTCSIDVGIPSLSFNLIAGSTPVAQASYLTFTCTAGSVITNLTATSTNGWRMAPTNNPTPTEYLTYQLSTTNISPSDYIGIIQMGLISGTPGSTTPEVMNTENIVINGQGTQIVVSLLVAPGPVARSLNVGAYSDQITFEATY